MHKNSKVLVVMHIYYINQTDLLSNCLKNIPTDYDLYVTMLKENKVVMNKIKKIKSDVHFIISENVGYDIWPFVKVINQIDLSKYSYLIKLHTKRDMHVPDFFDGELIRVGNGYFFRQGSNWRENLLEFITTKEHIQKCMNALDKNPNIGMCCMYNLIYDLGRFEDSIGNSVKEKYPDCFFGLKKFSFVAGTMFISKIAPIQMIKDMNITADLFEKSTKSHKNQFAHILERAIGAAVYKSGMKIVDAFTPKNHIKYINKLYKKSQYIKRCINYLVFWIPIPKIRRCIKENLMQIFYIPYIKHILNTDMNHRKSQKGL